MYMRKAQVSGAPAASLVIVIVSFILIFILLLPEEERDVLLEISDDVSSSGGDVEAVVLLEENPGTITKLREREFEHNIPSFNIFTEIEDSVLKSVDSVFVESGGVSEQTIPVFAEGGATNGRLAFAVSDFSGRLTIEFNGEQIFKGTIDSVLEPLAIPKIEEENVLRFSVDKPPGWRFWESNFYDIRNVQVTGTVERTERGEAIQTFFMSKEEANVENIDDAFIIYLVDCRIREAGRLSVFLNDNLLSSKVPDCGNLEKMFIDPLDFVEGKNEMRFVADGGRYLISQIFVKTKLKKPIFPVYFFDLNESLFSRISNGMVNTTIKMEFIDDREKKNAVLEVNGHKIFIDTRSKNISNDIDLFVVEGSNFIRIEPEKTLHVTDLRVEVDCKRARDCA